MATSDERQGRLDEFDDSSRCQAIAVDTEERCKHDAIAGTGYCAQHIDWSELDETV